MQEEAEEIVIRYYRVDPKRIVLLKSMLEGYEGLVVVRTADPKEGVVELLVSPDFLEEMKQILEDLSQQIWMEPLPGAKYPSPFSELAISSWPASDVLRARVRARARPNRVAVPDLGPWLKRVRLPNYGYCEPKAWQSPS